MYLRGITSITFGKDVERIPAHLCRGLLNIAYLTIPSSVTYIGTEAFCDCSGIFRIDAYPDPTQVSLGNNVFYNVPTKDILHVLPQYLEAYENADQWKDFFSINDDLVDPIPGDVNGDGRVNVSDVTTLINMILGITEKDEQLADINGDGRVNVSDVTALINIILGIE